MGIKDLVSTKGIRTTRVERVVPERFRLHAHHWLILHGRYVCKARKPDCASCVIADICKFKGKTV